jgi:hypothetical protein
MQKKTKTNFIDWICIHLIRVKEDDGKKMIADGKIQSRIKEDERNEYYELKDKIYSIAQRAEELLPAHFCCDKETVGDVLGRFWVISFFVTAISAAVICLTTGWLTSVSVTGGDISILGFYGVFLVHSFFALLTAFCFIVMFFCRCLGWSFNPGRAYNFFSILSSFSGNILTVCARKVSQWFNTDDSNLHLIFRCLKLKSQYFFAVSAILMNFFWFIFLIIFWATLISRFFATSYHFYIEEGSVSIAKHSQEGSLGRSIISLSGKLTQWSIDPITQREVDLVLKKSHENEESTYTEATPKEIDSVNTRWADFLCLLVFVGMIIPRSLLLIISVFWYYRCRRDFYPNIEDDYFKKLVAAMEAGNVVIPIPEPKGQPIDPPILPETPIPELPPTLPNKPLPSASITLICESGTTIPEAKWSSILSGDFTCFSEFTADCDRVTDWIKENGVNVYRFIVLFAIHFTPNDGTVNDLAKLLALLPNADKFVIFSCGERLRQKYQSEQAFQQHFNSWQRKILELGIADEQIIHFDHEHETVESRKRCIAGLVGKTNKTTVAGKFDEAGKLILQAAKKESPDLATLVKDITNIYQNEFNLFLKMVDKIQVPDELIQQTNDVLTQAGHIKDILTDDIEQTIKCATWLNVLKGAKKKVIPVLASGGLGLAVAVLVAPAVPVICLLPILNVAVAGAALGGTACMLIRSIPGVAECAQKNNSLQDETNNKDAIIESLVIESTTWALVLEMQGLPENEIVNNLASFLNQFDGKHLSIEHEREIAISGISTELKKSFPNKK